MCIRDSSGKIQVTCIYPGAFKTELAFSIKEYLKETSVRIVSTPILNKLENVPSKMIDELKASNLNFTIELGRSIGWKNYLGSITKSFSIDEFGISAPIKDLKEEYKFTAKNIGDEIKKYLD